jgi:hypothetical protein
MQTKKGKNRKEKDDAFAGRIINANEKKKKKGKTEKKKRETPNPFSNLIIHTQDYNEQLHIQLS